MKKIQPENLKIMISNLTEDAGDLLGGGDFMLRAGFAEIIRGQGAYISDTEMGELVSAAIEKHGQPKYVEEKE